MKRCTVERAPSQNVSAGRYSLDARIIELDYRLRRSDPVLLAAVPVMDELARKVRLDAVLPTLLGMKVIDTYCAGADPDLETQLRSGSPAALVEGSCTENDSCFYAVASVGQTL